MASLLNLLRHWFAHPEALWLLGLVPLLGLLIGLARRRRRKALGRWGYGPGLGALTSGGGAWSWLRGTGRALGLAFLIVAIAGPRWGRVDNPATVTGRDVVIVLDLSRSMLAQDVLGRSSPNRVGRARDGLLDLVDAVQRRGGHRLALVVFAARAQVVCPLTNDYDHFREALRTLDPDDPLLEIGPGPDAADGKPVSGTRIGRGLHEAVRAQDERFPGHQDMILISDGDDPAGDMEWREGIAAARAQGTPVHTVGVGDPDRDSPIPGPDGPLRFQGKPVQTRLREAVLEEIARQTGGTYTPARTRALPLGEIFQERIETRAGREDEDDVLPVYQQRSAWFFGMGLFWLTAEMALGDFTRNRRSRWKKRAAPQGSD